MEEISTQKLEEIAEIKKKVSRIRGDCGDPSGNIQKVEQELSSVMLSLASFTKGQQEAQSKSASSDTNSRSTSHTEVGYRQCIRIHAKNSRL